MTSLGASVGVGAGTALTGVGDAAVECDFSFFGRGAGCFFGWAMEFPSLRKKSPNDSDRAGAARNSQTRIKPQKVKDRSRIGRMRYCPMYANGSIPAVRVTLRHGARKPASQLARD